MEPSRAEPERTRELEIELRELIAERDRLISEIIRLVHLRDETVTSENIISDSELQEGYQRAE